MIKGVKILQEEFNHNTKEANVTASYCGKIYKAVTLPKGEDEQIYTSFEGLSIAECKIQKHIYQDKRSNLILERKTLEKYAKSLSPRDTKSIIHIHKYIGKLQERIDKMNEKIYELEQRITRQNKERLEFWEKFKKTDEYIHAYDDTKDYFLIDNNKKETIEEITEGEENEKNRDLD